MTADYQPTSPGDREYSHGKNEQHRTVDLLSPQDEQLVADEAYGDQQSRACKPTDDVLQHHRLRSLPSA